MIVLNAFLKAWRHNFKPVKFDDPSFEKLPQLTISFIVFKSRSSLVVEDVNSSVWTRQIQNIHIWLKGKKMD